MTRSVSVLVIDFSSAVTQFQGSGFLRSIHGLSKEKECIYAGMSHNSSIYTLT